MNKIFRHYLFILLPVMTLLVASCGDDEVKIPAPDIKSVSPTQGLPGATVTIKGTNLANATAVKFGATTAAVTNNTATSITTTVPAGLTAGNVNISVTTAGGTDTFVFTVLEQVEETPTITGVKPATGGVGTEVVVSGTKGTNFTGATTVRIGQTGIKGFEVNGAGTSITFTVPENATAENFTGRFTVVTPDGTVTSAENPTFTFEAEAQPATITVISPAMGAAGTYKCAVRNLMI